MYKVVLDEVHSYIEKAENGLSFEDAVNHIIEYCRDAEYTLQEDIWEVILLRGETEFSSMPVFVP